MWTRPTWRATSGTWPGARPPRGCASAFLPRDRIPAGQPRQRGVEELHLTLRRQPLRFQRGLHQQAVDQAHQLLADAHRVQVGGHLAAGGGLAQHPGHQLPPLPVPRPLHVAQRRLGAGRGPEGHPHPGLGLPLGVQRQGLEQDRAHRGQPAGTTLQVAGHPRAGRRVGVLYRGHEQGLLVLEVMRDHGRGAAGLGRDPTHAGRVEAVTGDHGAGRGGHPGPAFDGIDSAGHACYCSATSVVQQPS